MSYFAEDSFVFASQGEAPKPKPRFPAQAQATAGNDKRDAPIQPIGQDWQHTIVWPFASV